MSTDVDSQDSRRAVADAVALGLPALAAVVAGARDSIAVVDANQRFVYANPAACQMFGRPLEQLRGSSYSDRFPAREHAGMQDDPPPRASEDSATFTRVLRGPDGAEREVVTSTFTITMAESPYSVVVLRDLTDPRAAARTAIALAQTAARPGGTGTTMDDVLTRIARYAVDGTRAFACGIAVVGDDHTLASTGAFGPPGPKYGIENPVLIALTGVPVEPLLEAMTAGSIGFSDAPGKPVVVPDARRVWAANPLTRPMIANHVHMNWKAAIYVPLSSENRLIGLFVVYLPVDVAGPTEVELAFFTALADQTALLAINDRSESEAGRTAALLERGRLARELHDSVSQGLFSMTMQARAAQLSMSRDGMDQDEPLGRSVRELAELSLGALAEMRALIFELRPEALAEEGLIRALEKQAAAVAAREQLTITVKGPRQRPQLAAGVEDHLYRLVSEALHNVVKHAEATNADVTIETGPGILTVTVSDDGVGFDPTVRRPGHLGMVTMAERASTIGAELTVTGKVGSGVVVSLSMPYQHARP